MLRLCVQAVQVDSEKRPSEQQQVRARLPLSVQAVNAGASEEA